MNNNKDRLLESCNLIQCELMKHGDLYDGFLASIQSAINEKAIQIEQYVNIDCREWSEHILKRIIGEK